MPEKNTTTIYVTKWAFTKGVLKVEGAEVERGSAFWRTGYRGQFLNAAHGRDWHRTLACAHVRVDEMRKKKIAAMKKQIAKLGESPIVVTVKAVADS